MGDEIFFDEEEVFFLFGGEEVFLGRRRRMCSFLRERSFLGARHFKKALLLEGVRCRLVVIDVETGGWFSQEAVEFVDSGKSARDSPPRLSASVLRRLAHLAWQRRWMWKLTIACGRSFVDGCAPEPADLFLEIRDGQTALLFNFAVRDCTFFACFSSKKEKEKTMESTGNFRSSGKRVQN